MPSLEKIKGALQNVGIEMINTETYSIKPDLEDLFLYSGKENPELYFRGDVKNGISSFSLMSNQPEIDRGLLELRNDIDSKKIKGIIIKIDIYVREHPPPHFHAIYAEYEALIEIRTLLIYAGNLPKPQRKKVIEWAETKQEFLMQNFKRLNPRL